MFCNSVLHALSPQKTSFYYIHVSKEPSCALEHFSCSDETACIQIGRGHKVNGFSGTGQSTELCGPIKWLGIHIQICRGVELLCLTCPISLRTSNKIPIYLSWDKDCITLAKECIQIMRYIFSYFSKETYVLGTH